MNESLIRQHFGRVVIERLTTVNVYEGMNDKQIEVVKNFCLEKYNFDPFLRRL